MKKVLVGMFIALMGVFMVSCSNGGGIEKAKEIINELKADGAKLDKEGLKAKMMEFAEALKPEMTKIADMMKEVEKDPSKAGEMMQKLEGLKDIEPLMKGRQGGVGKEITENKHKLFKNYSLFCSTINSPSSHLLLSKHSSKSF